VRIAAAKIGPLPALETGHGHCYPRREPFIGGEQVRQMSVAVVAVAVVTALSGRPAHAQEEVGQFRTAVSAVGGLSVGSSQSFGLGDGRGGFGRGSGSGFAVGGALAHDFSSRLTLEATGLYLDRNAGAWSADAGLRLSLVPSGESLVPYFAVSGGVYGERSQSLSGAPLRTEDRRDDASAPPGRPPNQRGPNGLPVAVPAVPRDGRPTTGSLETSRRTDGLMTLGGGVVFAAGPHVFVRPDARAQVVFSGDTRVLGLFTLNFGYRF
jgi:hypothetical protein